MDLCLLTQGPYPPANTTQPIVPNSIIGIGLFLLFGGREGGMKGLVKQAGLIWEEGWRYSLLHANYPSRSKQIFPL